MLKLPLDPPSVYYPEPKTSIDPKVKDWISQCSYSHNEHSQTNWDVVLFGVPLSRSSISVSGASEFPEHFRRHWKNFSTYNIDYDLDLVNLNVLDIGDVQMHYTDILLSHDNIKRVMKGVMNRYSGSLPIAIGGDHSITAMLIKGIKEANPEMKIGILQFDTHLDLRDLKEHGPTNGTPIRNLIESNTVNACNIYNIGLHGFFNAPSLVAYAREQGLHYITLREARRNGITATVSEAVRVLEQNVDGIYLTIDLDVLDISNAPGVPASTPGGMRIDELFEAVFEAAQSKKIIGVDIVCIDPSKDSMVYQTVKVGVHTFLTILSGQLYSGKG